MAIQSSQSRKKDKDDGLSFFNPVLWQTGFFGRGKE